MAEDSYAAQHADTHPVSSAGVHALSVPMNAFVLRQVLLLSVHEPPLLSKSVVGTVDKSTAAHGKTAIEEKRLNMTLFF